MPPRTRETDLTIELQNYYNLSCSVISPLLLCVEYSDCYKVGRIVVCVGTLNRRSSCLQSFLGYKLHGLIFGEAYYGRALCELGAYIRGVGGGAAYYRNCTVCHDNCHLIWSPVHTSSPICSWFCACGFLCSFAESCLLINCAFGSELLCNRLTCW